MKFSKYTLKKKKEEEEEEEKINQLFLTL